MKMATYRILGKKGRITIPYEMRKAIGLSYKDVLSFENSKDGKGVIIKKEKICDTCKEATHIKQTDKVTFLDYLNSLSEEEKKAALVHLLLKLAENKNTENGEIR